MYPVIDRSDRYDADEKKDPKKWLASLLALPYGTPDSVKSERGLCMGLPTTWFFLSLMHLFWVQEAHERTLRERRTFTGRKLEDDNSFWRAAMNNAPEQVAICGDDLVAVWPTRMIDHYN